METPKDFIKRHIGDAIKDFPRHFSKAEICYLIGKYAKEYHEAKTKFMGISDTK